MQWTFCDKDILFVHTSPGAEFFIFFTMCYWCETIRILTDYNNILSSSKTILNGGIGILQLENLDSGFFSQLNGQS